MIKKVSYGFRNESIEEKTRWFLGLSLARRYSLSFGIAGLRGILYKGKETHDRGSFKTIQVLKKRKR